MSNEIRCPKCDITNQDDFTFCCKCGCKLDKQDSSIQQLNDVPLDSKPKDSVANALPFWRKIPGYRSKTPWKMVLATFVYGFIILQLIIPKQNTTISNKEKTSAAVLYQQLESVYKNKDYEKAKNVFGELLSKYPEAPETLKGKQMIDGIDKVIQQEKEDKTKEEQRKAEEDKKRAEEAEQKKARLASALSYTRTKYDEVKDITWYYDNSTSNYSNETDFYAYIGKSKTGNPWLRFRIQFGSDDWLFIKKYTIKTDETTFTITTNYNEVKRDVVYGNGISEWYDVPLDSEKAKIVKAVIASQKTILRCEGEKYYKDRTITAEEKAALQHILDSYEALGGTSI